jgi:hypothetical protein
MRPHPAVRRVVVLAAVFAAGGACNKRPPPDTAAADAAVTVDASPQVDPAEVVLRADFGKKYSCPDDRVAVKTRPDIDAEEAMAPDGDHEDRSLGTPSDEVKNDPERYAKWKADREAVIASRKARYDGYTIWEVTGCGHTDLLGCHEYVSHHGGATYSGGPPVCTVARPPPVTLAAIGTAPLTDKWTPLSAPPIPGGYRPFDAVGNIEWASSIATAWSADAMLFLVQVASVQPDATIDLSANGGATVKYFFSSASKGIELGIEANPVADRRRDAGAGALARIVVNGPRDKLPRHLVEKPACSLARAIAALKGAGVLSKADPTFGFDVELWTGAKSLWRITYRQSVTQGFIKNTSSFHRDVDAATCALEPAK